MYRRQNVLWLESEELVYKWVELPKNTSNSRFEIKAVKKLGNFVVNLKTRSMQIILDVLECLW